MSLKDTLEQLKALGSDKVRSQNTKSGAGDNPFGVKLGDIRMLAKKIERALAIGESLGVFRDYPTSKSCASPFAPIWINEMVRRQG